MHQQKHCAMNVFLIVFVTAIWLYSTLSLAGKFGVLGMDFSLALIVLVLLPVVNTILLVYLRKKQAKKEGKKFINFDWVGNFSEIFKEIKKQYD